MDKHAMNPVNLAHIIYASIATPAFDPADLKAILQTARNKNAKLSITGMLLYTSNCFFQVLEGDDVTLAELFVKIEADPRHMNLTKIIHEPISHRVFGDWSMGFAEIELADLESIEGFNEFFQQGNSLVNLPPGRAKKLLTAFAQGRWRAQIRGNG